MFRPLAFARPGWALPMVLVLAGCRAQRELIITSAPAGAAVRVDDELVGTTPLTLPFIHYGVRRITLYLPHHQSTSVLANVEPPWYGAFPMDLLTEIAIPMGWRDRHRVHVVLNAGADDVASPTLRSVFERAEALRRAGPEGPRGLPPPPVLESRDQPPVDPAAPAPAPSPTIPPADSPAPPRPAPQSAP